MKNIGGHRRALRRRVIGNLQIKILKRLPAMSTPGPLLSGVCRRARHLVLFSARGEVSWSHSYPLCPIMWLPSTRLPKHVHAADSVDSMAPTVARTRLASPLSYPLTHISPTCVCHHKNISYLAHRTLSTPTAASRFLEFCDV